MPAPTSYSVVRAGSPSSTIAAFAVVPPMSNEITLPRPAERAMSAQAMTPAAGPDSTRNAGFCAAAAADIVPPFDCMMCKGPVTPALFSWVDSEET